MPFFRGAVTSSDSDQTSFEMLHTVEAGATLLVFREHPRVSTANDWGRVTSVKIGGADFLTDDRLQREGVSTNPPRVGIWFLPAPPTGEIAVDVVLDGVPGRRTYTLQALGGTATEDVFVDAFSSDLAEGTDDGIETPAAIGSGQFAIDAVTVRNYDAEENPDIEEFLGTAVGGQQAHYRLAHVLADIGLAAGGSDAEGVAALAWSWSQVLDAVHVVGVFRLAESAQHLRPVELVDESEGWEHEPDEIEPANNVNHPAPDFESWARSPENPDGAYVLYRLDPGEIPGVKEGLVETELGKEGPGRLDVTITLEEPDGVGGWLIRATRVLQDIEPGRDQWSLTPAEVEAIEDPEVIHKRIVFSLVGA